MIKDRLILCMYEKTTTKKKNTHTRKSIDLNISKVIVATQKDVLCSAFLEIGDERIALLG